MLSGILSWWIKHSVSLQMVILAEALYAGETNPYPEYVSITVMVKHVLLLWKWFNIANLPPGHGLVTLENDAISGTQSWSLLLAY